MPETDRVATFTVIVPFHGNDGEEAKVARHLLRGLQSTLGKGDFTALGPTGQIIYHSDKPLPEFEQIIAWLRGERGYVIRKWGAEQDEEHVLEGMDEGSWLWDRVIANYTQRVRLIGIEAPRGKQAYMKIISSLVGLGEALIRARGPLPEPGHESGELGES